MLEASSGAVGGGRGRKGAQDVAGWCPVGPGEGCGGAEVGRSLKRKWQGFR